MKHCEYILVAHKLHRTQVVYLSPPPPQGGCYDLMPQSFPTQQVTATGLSLDPKLPSYTSQFTPPAQFPAELATVGQQQALGYGAPRGTFLGGAAVAGLRPGVSRPPQGMGPQPRLPPNQLRLQLQQRLQGPQQVRAKTQFTFWDFDGYVESVCRPYSPPLFCPS